MPSVRLFAVVAMAMLYNHVVDASRYNLTNVLQSVVVGGCTPLLSEKEMFTSKNNPTGVDQDSHIKIYGSLVASNPVESNVNVSFVFLHSLSSLVDHERFCSSMQPQLQDFVDEAKLTKTESVTLTGDKAVTFNAISPVTTSDIQAIMVCACAGNLADEGSRLDFSQDSVLEFRNPYGYLPGALYGFLPFYGLVSALYLVLLVVFVVLCIRHRHKLLHLQLAIVVVILMGLVQNVASYFTYNRLNETGVPYCCPIPWDVVFCFAINDFKKCVSALLVLSVSLGFGVVKPNLSRGTTIRVLTLGAVYLVSTLWHDFTRINNINHADYDTVPSYASLVVAISDLIIIFWVSTSITRVKEELAEAKQMVKLGMYQSLTKTLYTWVFVWVLFTLLQVAVSSNYVYVPWNLNFLLWGFWDTLYLGILVSICYIWAPSDTASEYAYSHQLPTEDPDGDIEDSLALNAPDTAAHFEIGEGDDDDDDDFEGELEMVLGDRKDSKDEDAPQDF